MAKPTIQTGQMEFLEAYFTQKRAYPDHVGACILLPCWRQFANIPELQQMTSTYGSLPQGHTYSVSRARASSTERTWQASRGRSTYTTTCHDARPSMHRRIKVAKLWSSRPKWGNNVPNYCWTLGQQTSPSLMLRHVEDLRSPFGFPCLLKRDAKLTGKLLLPQ